MGLSCPHTKHRFAALIKAVYQVFQVSRVYQVYDLGMAPASAKRSRDIEDLEDPRDLVDLCSAFCVRHSPSVRPLLEQFDCMPQHRQDDVEPFADAFRAARQIDNERPAADAGEAAGKDRHWRLFECPGPGGLPDTRHDPIDYLQPGLAG